MSRNSMKRQLDWPEVYRQRKFLLPAFRQRSRASILSRDATLAKSCPDPRRARIDNSRRSINLNSAPCGEYLPAGNKRLRRSEEHTSELQSRFDLVCRLLLEKK